MPRAGEQARPNSRAARPYSARRPGLEPQKTQMWRRGGILINEPKTAIGGHNKAQNAQNNKYSENLQFTPKVMITAFTEHSFFRMDGYSSSKLVIACSNPADILFPTNHISPSTPFNGDLTDLIPRADRSQ